MARSPQDVYAKLLLSPRGYPLWTPEPSNELLTVRRGGLMIGDVGVVLPEDGGFDVFFNICLPHDHPFHRRHGVPEENPGRIISTSSVKRVRSTEPPSDVATRARTGTLDYEFDLSSREGALLILPAGAERYELLNDDLLSDQAKQHGTAWYYYAVQRRRRTIRHDSLYLITGFHKARSWSVAAFENTTGNERFNAQFKQVEGSTIPAGYTWETTRALDWRVGPAVDDGIPSQAVFIRGFKIALKTWMPGTRWISVKAGAPSARAGPSRPLSFSPGTGFGNVQRGGSKSFGGFGIGKSTHRQGADLIDDEAQRDNPNLRAPDGAAIGVEIQRIPDVPQVFHPSDIINQYLLHQEPSATIAVTHDKEWISMLEKDLLRPEELLQEDRVKRVVSEKYHIVSQAGAVYLHNNSDPSVDALDTSNMLHTNFCVDEPNVENPIMTAVDTVGTRSTLGALQHANEVANPNTIVALQSSHSSTGSNASQVELALAEERRSNLSSVSRGNPSAVATPGDVQIPRARRNVIFFGEIGVGKSSIINLLLEDGTFATVSNGSEPCTRHSARYETEVRGAPYTLWDTRGLQEGSNFLQYFFGGTRSAKELKKFLRERHSNGEIDLLVYCVRGSRTTKASLTYYESFCQITRRLAAPVAIVVTQLEREVDMESWWKINSSHFRDLGMEFDGHACITGLQGHPRAAESKQRLVELISREYRWEAKEVGSYFGSPVPRSVAPRPLNRSLLNAVLRRKPKRNAIGPTTTSLYTPAPRSLLSISPRSSLSSPIYSSDEARYSRDEIQTQSLSDAMVPSTLPSNNLPQSLEEPYLPSPIDKHQTPRSSLPMNSDHPGVDHPTPPFNEETRSAEAASSNPEGTLAEASEECRSPSPELPVSQPQIPPSQSAHRRHPYINADVGFTGSNSSLATTGSARSRSHRAPRSPVFARHGRRTRTWFNRTSLAITGSRPSLVSREETDSIRSSRF